MNLNVTNKPNMRKHSVIVEVLHGNEKTFLCEVCFMFDRQPMVADYLVTETRMNPQSPRLACVECLPLTIGMGTASGPAE